MATANLTIGPFSPVANVQDDAVSPGVVAICGLNIILVVVFLVGRIYSNLSTTRLLHLDDYACIAATILSFAYSGILFSILNYSQSQPGSGWSDGFYLKATYAANTISGPALFFAKSAVLILYHRIFQPQRLTRYCIYFALATCFCLAWITVPLYTYFCASHSGNWDASLAQQCSQVSIFGIVMGAVDVALGVYILVLPVPAVAKLQLPLKKRLGVTFIFMHGIFALVGSVAGLYYRVRLAQGGNALFYQTVVMICLSVENDMTIVTSSMHPCAAYLKRMNGSSVSFGSLRSKLFGSLSSTSENQTFTGHIRGFSDSRIDAGKTKSTQSKREASSSLPSRTTSKQGWDNRRNFSKREPVVQEYILKTTENLRQA